MDINNFRVNPSGNELELWVAVPQGPNYDNITIERIAIQDCQHYTVGYPEKPQVELTRFNPVEELRIENGKEVIRCLKFKDLNLLGLNCSGLYFMYVKQTGIYPEETPCDCNKDVTIAVAVNRYPIYNKILKLLDEDHCKNPQEQQLDLYLHSLAFYAAVEMQDYIQAIDIFNTMMSIDINAGSCFNNCSRDYSTGTGNNITTGGCGCAKQS